MRKLDLELCEKELLDVFCSKFSVLRICRKGRLQLWTWSQKGNLRYHVIVYVKWKRPAAAWVFEAEGPTRTGLDLHDTA